MKLLPTLSAMTLGMLIMTGCSTSSDEASDVESATVTDTKFITIGTGGVTGTYYPTGGAI